MKATGIAAAFKHYGAKLHNVNWSVSERVGDEIVMSLWQHRIIRGVYRDKLSRWSGPGNSRFAVHLRQALDEQLPIRVVLAIADDPAAIDRGEDGSTIKKEFRVLDDMIGRAESFDGDNFEIRLARIR